MLEAFQPQGNASLIIATTTASAGIQPSTGGIIGCLLTNMGSGVVYIAASPSSAVAAVIPTTSTPATGTPILAGSAQTFNFAPNFWLSALTSSGTANINLQPGFGV
jgi:hypothetical protein